MGTGTALKKLLKSLCHNTRWKYAVFWKLKGMELSWEDCYVDNENSAGFLNGKPGIINFGFGGDTKCGNSMKCPIEAVVVSLSRHGYRLGEGIIGKVASQRKHHWAYVDDVESRLHEEFPEEWNQQSLVGIKTIVLVPVIPLGVVQLGSLDVVLEDFSVVVDIRECFGAILNSSGTWVSLSPKTNWHDSYAPFAMPLAHIPPAMDVLNQMLEADEGPYTDEKQPTFSDLFADHIEGPYTDEKQPTFSDLFADHIEGPYTDEKQPTFSDLFADHIEESPAIDLSVFSDYMTECDLSAFSWLEDESNVTSINHRLISRHPTIPNRYAKDLEHKEHDQGFRTEIDEETNSVADNECLSFPSDSELHKALGQSSKGYGDKIWNTVVSGANEWSSSASFCQTELSEVFSPIFEDVDAWCTKEKGKEQLLDAVIDKLLGTSDDNDDSSESACVKSCSNSSSKCAGSCLIQCKTEDGALDLGESVSCSYKRALLASENEGLTNSPTKSSNRSTDTVSLSSGEQDVVCRLYKKGPKSTNAIRKRANAGDAPKPKPRDRQLIQDRIKELRELIPNGSKCSIDALLDRTIKHMLFLQCVPSQAEKLRHSAQPKVKGEYWNSSGCRSHKNGASWAYELGQDSNSCPISVEDLDQPGQILVEIQCENYELFLDIAQVIRRLKLTILKGILETRLNKPWAHFVVETPKGFHRMEILWPLVQLLQRNNIPMTSMF